MATTITYLTFGTSISMVMTSLPIINDVKESTTITSCLEYCINGVDAAECLNTVLNCNCIVNTKEYYLGHDCSQVHLDVTEPSISPRTVNFSWPVDPLIDEQAYKFVFKELAPLTSLDSFLVQRGNDNNDPDTIYSQDFHMITDRTARITSLDSGAVNYTICVLHRKVAEAVEDTNNLTRLDHVLYPDCVSILTKASIHWEYQLTFYLISALMILVIVGLIILR